MGMGYHGYQYVAGVLFSCSVWWLAYRNNLGTDLQDALTDTVIHGQSRCIGNPFMFHLVIP